MMRKLVKAEYLFLGLILFLTFLFRFPSLFEPFWYGDEGIFGAVARNLNQGGVLYQTAWDNKPPLIYLTYATIFKFFGVSMFWLRLVTAVVVLATACVVYEIAKAVIGQKRALWATLIFGFLTSLRLVEGNLALTEIYMILPTAAAFLWLIYRKFDYPSLFGAGVLFALASLYKQVGALEAAAVVLYLFLASKSLGGFLRQGVVLALGFALPFAGTLAYFATRNLAGDFIFAAYTYYRIYLGESPKYALLINVLKFLPIGAAFVLGLTRKSRNKLTVYHLILLWSAFSFLGSYFSGRTYGHYLVQAIPALSILLASFSPKLKFSFGHLAFALFYFLPLIFLTKLLFTDFLSGGPINQIKYWRNFVEFAAGRKSLDAYNNYFDSNVNSIMGLADFLRWRGALGKSVYIWGDYPWLYAISDSRNPSRYVTSFHVFGVPKGREEVSEAIRWNRPEYIIKPPASIGEFPQLEKLLADHYTFVAQIENSGVWARSNDPK